MGVLEMTGNTADPGGEPAPAAADPTTDAGRARAPDGTFVSAEQLQPDRPSRRASKTQETVEAAFDARWSEREKAWNQQIEQERQQWRAQREEDARRSQELQQNFARIQGALEEMRARPVYQPPQQQGPEPDDLDRQADKALSENNWAEFRRLSAMAADARAERKFQPLIEQKLNAFRQDFEKKIPPQIPPHVQVLLARHQNVAMAGPRGVQAVIAEKQRLDIYQANLPEQQREQMAWAQADKLLAPQAAARPNGFDPAGAAALSGAPAVRSGGGGSQGGAQPSQADVDGAKRAGMSLGEWMKWKDPFKSGLAE